jgi:hypothetical protein
MVAAAETNLKEAVTNDEQQKSTQSDFNAVYLRLPPDR